MPVLSLCFIGHFLQWQSHLFSLHCICRRTLVLLSALSRAAVHFVLENKSLKGSLIGNISVVTAGTDVHYHCNIFGINKSTKKEILYSHCMGES